MTNPPYGPTPGGQWPQPGSPAGQPSAWPAVPPKQSRGPVIISLVVAVIAMAVAVAAWFRPAPDPPAAADSSPKYSAQEVTEADRAMCAAYDKVYAALAGSGGQSSTDPNIQLVIALNTRLATHVNSDYLRQALAQNPATTPDLAGTFRKMASAYDEIVLGQLAGSQTADLQQFNDQLDAADTEAKKACK
jgi:hypothetical protein